MSERSKTSMSVLHEINALALINIRDIFGFLITATDEAINRRYGSEEEAVNVAEKIANVAFRAAVLEEPIKVYSMKYNQPTGDLNGDCEYVDKVVQFYDTERRNR